MVLGKRKFGRKKYVVNENGSSVIQCPRIGKFGWEVTPDILFFHSFILISLWIFHSHPMSRYNQLDTTSDNDGQFDSSI